MKTSKIEQALLRKNTSRPPVWFMRQAGRYHSHYQALRKQYSFEQLCKQPELTRETTMGPIREFGFDSAILFSDILFPLATLGMDLSYPESKPTLSWHLKSKSDLKKLSPGKAAELDFQAEAVKLVRKDLPEETGLLGFVGGPWTLFCYAVEGAHHGSLISSKSGLEDGRFDGFVSLLEDLLVDNMVAQALGGATAVAVLDTCAGELDPQTFKERIVPVLKQVFKKFKSKCPEVPLIYYAKTTGPDHWENLKDLPFEGLGIDWRQSLAKTLLEWGDRWAIQGNVDPTWLFLDSVELSRRLHLYFNRIKELPSPARAGWICGLGHGVLPGTPEANVHLFLKLQKEIF